MTMQTTHVGIDPHLTSMASPSPSAYAGVCKASSAKFSSRPPHAVASPNVWSLKISGFLRRLARSSC